MSEERLNLIKENVYTRCSIANITGIGMTAPDKEEVELIEEIERLNNIIDESAEEILKELEENHHLSYGVALAIRQKLLDYKELKGSESND